MAWRDLGRDRHRPNERHIVIYDYGCLGMELSAVVQDLPVSEWRRVQRARGYRYMMVNGEVTFMDGQPTKLTSGLLLRLGGGSNKPQNRAS
jgi:N-acyl-D-amino-acid deacylase